MTFISASMVADSIMSKEHRLSTLEAVMPRMVLAEFNTHRALSRNSASSRAIPFNRMVKQVLENPFIPMAFQKDHSGMQGTEYITEAVAHQRRVDQWLVARDLAVYAAKKMHEPLDSVYDEENYPFFYEDQEPVTKQICNRILEPYMYHKALVSATEWSNFMYLRDHDAAEIHIRELARAIKRAMATSAPKELQPGEWHLPYGDKLDDIALHLPIPANATYEDVLTLKVKIATARDARLSYQTFGDDPKIDYVADVRLHDQLLAGGHMSPFEHPARAMNDTEYRKYYVSRPADLMVPSTFSNSKVPLAYVSQEIEYGWCGNYRGFVQYRKMIPNENR